MGGILVLKAVWMLSTKVLQCGLSTQIRSPRESSMYTCEDKACTSCLPSATSQRRRGNKRAGCFPRAPADRSRATRHSPPGRTRSIAPLSLRGSSSAAHLPRPSAPFTAAATSWERPTHLDKDLGPVLILLVRGHEEAAGQHGHQAVPLGLEVDGGVPPQEAAQSLQETAWWPGRPVLPPPAPSQDGGGDARPSPR